MARSTSRARSLCALIEALEPRQLFSAVSPLHTIMHPQLDVLAQAQPHRRRRSSPRVYNQAPSGYTPDQIRQAYGFNQVSFPTSGGTVAGNGAGQTIAIVTAYADPNIVSDLHHFDSQFGLSNPPSFSVVSQGSGITADSGWALETSLDVEWAHAIAPQANIVLVQASAPSLGNLLSAVDMARSRPDVSVVSMSWGGSEFASEPSFDHHFTTPAGHQGITFVAAAGDQGAPLSWPASSPNVLSVGGTTLATGSSGSYAYESSWSGSGGGISSYEAAPSYQQFGAGARVGPDVAYSADPGKGFPVYDSYGYGRRNGWFEVGGTSAGSPQWAALIAIADQGRALAGKGTLDGATQTLPMLYSMPPSNFHDITTGASAGYPMYAAGPGYDLVTGLGSPFSDKVITGLTA